MLQLQAPPGSGPRKMPGLESDTPFDRGMRPAPDFSANETPFPSEYRLAETRLRSAAMPAPGRG
ncbi:hypothetical protein D3C71_1426660 [compost metagenome]